MASYCNQYETLLSGCVGLDLTDEKGFICGEILCELGAEVIKVEPPQGDRSRNIGPYWHNEADPEKSLYWFAYNRDKKSSWHVCGHEDCCVYLGSSRPTDGQIFCRLRSDCHSCRINLAPLYAENNAAFQRGKGGLRQIRLFCSY